MFFRKYNNWERRGNFNRSGQHDQQDGNIDLALFDSYNIGSLVVELPNKLQGMLCSYMIVHKKQQLFYISDTQRGLINQHTISEPYHRARNKHDLLHTPERIIKQVFCPLYHVTFRLAYTVCDSQTTIYPIFTTNLQNTVDLFTLCLAISYLLSVCHIPIHSR